MFKTLLKLFNLIKKANINVVGHKKPLIPYTIILYTLKNRKTIAWPFDGYVIKGLES